jgi:hypothetical protein
MNSDPKGTRTAEVAHEALIRGWPRLRRWMDEDRAALQAHHRLAEAAREWRRFARDDSGLYRGARLAEALDLRDQRAADLNESERAFLEASVERIQPLLQPGWPADRGYCQRSERQHVAGKQALAGVLNVKSFGRRRQLEWPLWL